MVSKIEEVIKDIADGKIVIVIDDFDRENEGDFVMAAEKITPEAVNFMAKHGRGLICTPLLENRCEELGLDLMVEKNNAAFETPFTISVDLIGNGCTTGISASDRSKTIQALVDPNTKKEALGKPGHIFPLKAKMGGVLRRAGHTEAAVDLARMAGLNPSGVIVEIMNEDGTMARLNDLMEISKKFDLKIISIEEIIEFRLQKETLVSKIETKNIKTIYGKFELSVFKQKNDTGEHFVLKKGDWEKNDKIPVRVHIGNPFEDIFCVNESPKKFPLRRSLEILSKCDKGLILYMNTQETSANAAKKFIEAKITPQNMDKKDYGIGAQILREMNIRKIKLMTQNPERKNLKLGFGLEIVDIINA